MRVHEVRDFSKRGDALPIPNLIDIQIESYQRFLQKEVEPNKRKNDGLEALLREVFPSKATTRISSWNTSATIWPSRATPPTSAAPCV